MKAQDIKANPNNPRFIKDEKFKLLVKSLKEFPEMAVVRPVVINEENTILGGNMRYRAMIEAGWDDIPVTKVKGWTKEQEKEFIIKDNVSGGEWDWDVLANEWDMDELQDWGLDLPAKFGDDEVEEDEAPEVSDEPPISKLGEIYQLGRHRVMCGDSFKDMDILINNAKANLIFTDPPYGIGADKGYGGGVASRRSYEDKWDSEAPPKTFFDELLKKSDKSIIFGANHFCDRLPVMHHWIVWDKAGEMDTSNDSFSDCELAWTNIPRISTRKFTVIQHGFISEEPTRYHPTQKPVKLVSKILKVYSEDDELILDLFLGSGSTLIACEQTDRTCYGMELDPKYVDVIRKRYIKFTNNNELPDNWAELTPVVV